MKTKKAAAVTAAGDSKQRNEAYPSAESLSRRNLRQEIGILLLCLQFPVGQDVSQIGWTLFERLLRRYMGLKCASKCLSEPSESSNARQGVSG
jgi:hypothetical protein